MLPAPKSNAVFRNGKISGAHSTVSNEAAKAYDIPWPPVIVSNTADGRSPVNEYEDRSTGKKLDKWEIVLNKKN